MCAHRSLSLSLFLLLVLLPLPAASQPAPASDARWGLRVRAVLSGDSWESQPAGIRIYSGIALEAAVVRRLSDAAVLELSFRTESREVEGPRDAGVEHRWGSLEMIPVTLSAQWRPRGHGDAAWQPYLGAGINLTATWEKSGLLDATNEPLSVGPAVVLGMDWRIRGGTTFLLDARWNTLSVDLEDFGPTVPLVKIDPLSIGAGVGVRF